MKITKKIVATALVSVMALTPAGCSKAGTGKESQTSTTKEETTTSETTTSETTSETTTSETTTSETTTTEETTTKTAESDSYADPTEPENLFVTIDGTNYRVGINYADIRDAMGFNRQLETIGSTGITFIRHQKDNLGYAMDENKATGKVDIIFVDSSVGDTSAALLGGKIKVGDSLDAVIKEYGEPGLTDSETAVYAWGNTGLFIKLDSKKIVQGFSIVYVTEPAH